MAIALNTWYTTSNTGGTVKLTGGTSGKPEYGIRLRYKANSNSASTNKTNITVQLQVRTTKSAYNTYGPNQTTTIQGTALSAKKISKFTVNSWVTFGERTFDVAHESNGTKTITLSGSFTTTATTSSYGQYSLKSGSVSVSVELPTIPRYAAITAFSLSRTINTITMSYSVDSTIDSTQYSLNNGSWTAYPSGGIITGLSPATTYNVKIRVKRTDSQLWTTTDNKAITTYDYAKITEAPNINIGNSATVKYTNPGGYTTVVGIYNTAGSVAIAEYRSTSGGTYTFSFTTTEINNMYAQTPKANQVTLRYYLRTTCNGSNYYHYVDRTFSVVNSDPIFSNFTYQDINSKTLALTGDSSKIIKKYSNLKVTISAANKMVAKNSATPVNYNVIAGSSSVSVAYSSTADVTGTINNVNSNDVTVYAVDSRGNQTPKSKSFSVVDYTECSIKTLRIDRVDGVGENIQLTMTGTYSTTNFGTTTNNIKTAQLRMKAKTASSYGDWVSILNRLSISGGKITADNITISDVTFALGTEYDVQIRIADELAEDIETASISDGTVLWSAVKGKGVNFGGLYDPDEGGELQVNGKKVQGIEIIDNLSSSSTIAGLSANQGRVLNNKFGDYLPLTGGTISGQLNCQFINPTRGNEWNFVPSDSSATDMNVGYRSCNTSGKETANAINVYKFRNGQKGWANVQAKEMEAVAGLLKSTSNGNTVSIGSQNSSWCHIYNSANIPFYFNRVVYANSGHRLIGYKEIYSNNAGVTGTITLSESAANFNMLEIFYHGDTDTYSSVRIWSPNGRRVALDLSYINPDNHWIQGVNKSISGKSITTINASETKISVSPPGVAKKDYIKITKVLGWY